MRIGLLGVGRLGAAHAATLSTLPQVSELRIHDAEPALAREVAVKVGARAVESVDAALEALRVAEAAGRSRNERRAVRISEIA